MEGFCMQCTVAISSIQGEFCPRCGTRLFIRNANTPLTQVSQHNNDSFDGHTVFPQGQQRLQYAANHPDTPPSPDTSETASGQPPLGATSRPTRIPVPRQQQPMNFEHHQYDKENTSSYALVSQEHPRHHTLPVAEGPYDSSLPLENQPGLPPLTIHRRSLFNAPTLTQDESQASRLAYRNFQQGLATEARDSTVVKEKDSDGWRTPHNNVLPNDRSRGVDPRTLRQACRSKDSRSRSPPGWRNEDTLEKEILRQREYKRPPSPLLRDAAPFAFKMVGHSGNEQNNKVHQDTLAFPAEELFPGTLSKKPSTSPSSTLARKLTHNPLRGNEDSAGHHVPDHTIPIWCLKCHCSDHTASKACPEKSSWTASRFLDVSWGPDFVEDGIEARTKQPQTMTDIMDIAYCMAKHLNGFQAFTRDRDEFLREVERYLRDKISPDCLLLWQKCMAHCNNVTRYYALGLYRCILGMEKHVVFMPLFHIMSLDNITDRWPRSQETFVKDHRFIAACLNSYRNDRTKNGINPASYAKSVSLLNRYRDTYAGGRNKARRMLEDAIADNVEVRQTRKITESFSILSNLMIEPSVKRLTCFSPDDIVFPRLSRLTQNWRALRDRIL